MTKATKVLLINPPLWNVYAPHLAVPLLTATLKAHGWPAIGADLGIEIIDWLLSAEGLTAIGERLEERARTVASDERRRVDRAFAVLPSAIEYIDRAKQALRRVEVLHDHDTFIKASRHVRNALWCISAAFDKLDFDLKANNQYYSTRSTREVLEAAEDPDRNIYRWVLERRPPPVLQDPEVGLVGISLSADTQLVAAMTIAKIVREQRPDVRITMGGNFATRMVSRWQERHPFFDLIDNFVLYEGEEALPALCERDLSGRNIDVPGLVESTPSGALRRTDPVPVDLDKPVTPDFTDLPLDRYFAPGPILPLLASRSCMWHCAFCSIPFASNKFRMRSTSSIVRDMEHLAAIHHTRYFMFVDEIMTIRTLRELARDLPEGRFYWYGETRFAPGLNDDLAHKLRRSGCRRLDLGLESFNQRVLDLMQKGTSVSYIPNNLYSLMRGRVPFHLFVIIGFPGETAEEARHTIDFATASVKQAREEFGIEYCTWAASPFVLDMLSPVGENPEAFGVKPITPPADKDLAFSLDYHVQDGLSQTQSDELAVLTDHVPGTAQATLSEVPFHQGGVDIGDAEEYIFLRACEESSLPTKMPARELLIHEGLERATCWLADDVSIWPAAASFLDREGGPCLLLYRAVTDGIEELDLEFVGALPRSGEQIGYAELCGRFITATGMPQQRARALVDQLVRSGFLDTDAKRVRVQPFDQQLIFRQESGVIAVFDNDSRRGKLVSARSGQCVQLNAKAFAAWLVCKDGSSPYSPELLFLISSPERWAEVFATLACEGFIYPERCVPSAVFDNQRKALPQFK